MKLIQKSNYLSPTVVFHFEKIALAKKITFNNALNQALEEYVKKENDELEIKNILAEIKTLKETQSLILEVLQTALEKRGE